MGPGARDDLRQQASERGTWQHGIGDLEGEGIATDQTRADAELEPSRTASGPSSAHECYEEIYGTPSKAKWRLRFLPLGKLSAGERKAKVSTSITALAQSGQPKEDIYR